MKKTCSVLYASLISLIYVIVLDFFPHGALTSVGTLRFKETASNVGQCFMSGSNLLFIILHGFSKAFQTLLQIYAKVQDYI